MKILLKESITLMDRIQDPRDKLNHARFATEQNVMLHSFLAGIILHVYRVHKDVSVAQFVESPSMISLKFINNEKQLGKHHL